jgi:hypothetical protein
MSNNFANDPVVYQQNEEDSQAVRSLCQRLGYGYVMEEASLAWQDYSRAGGRYGVGLVVGPHIRSTVPCGCESELAPAGYGCEWCGGCGWLTKKVAELKAGGSPESDRQLST